MMMEHSNPQGIDHSKRDIYQAFTGKSGKLGSFIDKHLREVLETVEVSEGVGHLSVSNVLLVIMTHPTLTDEEKMLLATEYGRGRGLSDGVEEVCSNCAIGPASQLIHSFIGNGLEGKP